ncbi:MAG: hypothetical protein MI749_16660 [Desulfovibrionales bacterium]|nr:hypothetical protein [Desulfovibrionales bacterium]
MASYIPSNLHFMWDHEVFPLLDRQRFVKWVVENPKYAVSIWVRRQHGEQFANELAEELDRQTATFVKEEEHEIHVVKAPDRWRVAVRGTDVTRPYRLFTVRLLEMVDPHSDDFSFQAMRPPLNEEYVANDVMRLWMLYMEGGIYLDIESESIGLPLPDRIKAPKDLLVGVLYDGGPYFTDSALAFPKESHKILSLLHYMDGNYTKELKTTPPFTSKEDAEELQKHRENQQKIWANSELLREYKEAQHKELLNPMVPEEFVLIEKARQEEARKLKHQVELLDAGIDFVSEEKHLEPDAKRFENRPWRVTMLSGQQMLTEWLRKFEGIEPDHSEIYDLVKQADYPIKLKPVDHFEPF